MLKIITETILNRLKYKRLILFLALSGNLSISSGYPIYDNPWEKWDQETIARANTAAGIDYLSEEEKQVILFTNLARWNGTLFVSTFLNKYMGNIKPSRYSRSLIRDLKKVKGLQPLRYEDDLYEVAMSHAVKSGKSGHTGHRNFDASG